MIDYETFLTELYVMVDDYCKYQAEPVTKRGRKSNLSRSEIVTLAIAGQWFWFGSERGFYRFIVGHLLSAFPSMPSRAQLNRLMRQEQETITAFALFVTEQVGEAAPYYEALDSSAVPTRDINRRGRGWLPGIANYGISKRIGYYEGVHLLISVMPIGIITGFGFGAASEKDSVLAETFLAARAYPQPGLSSVGRPAPGDYVADKAFSYDTPLVRWATCYGANVICAPKKNSLTRRWPKRLRRWLAGLRQIVETVFDKLHNTFRLVTERPHDLTGLQARLAAKVALHNFCIYLNLQLGRKPLAFADLITM
jgi:hypothetical protein